MWNEIDGTPLPLPHAKRQYRRAERRCRSRVEGALARTEREGTSACDGHRWNTRWALSPPGRLRYLYRTLRVTLSGWKVESPRYLIWTVPRFCLRAFAGRVSETLKWPPLSILNRRER